MQWIAFVKNPKLEDFNIAILAYELDYPSMRKSYVEDGLRACGAGPSIDKEVIALKLPFEISGAKKKKKALPVAEQREALREILQKLEQTNVRHILVANPDYFKTLTGCAKAALEVGSLYPPTSDHFEEFSHLKVAYVPNHKMAFYDPIKTASGIQITCKSVIEDQKGSYQEPGHAIIKTVHYPTTVDEIRDSLYQLMDRDIAVDIEGFSLDMHDAGIASISFATDEHTAMAFQVDYGPGLPNWPVREVLVDFFFDRAFEPDLQDKPPKNIWHNAAYDIPVLVHHLTGDLPDSSDGRDVYHGRDNNLEFLCRGNNLHDTKIISYLATNSTAGNKLSLKEQAVEFAGNYAVDEIKDVTQLTVEELLEYNVVDTLSTWYVFNKNYPKMVADLQENVYNELFLPALIDIIDMQLNGLPVNMETVKDSKIQLELFERAALDRIFNLQVVKEYTYHLKEKYVAKKNAEYKKKRITVSDVDLEFNPGSSAQLAGLLYDPKFLNLPVLARTESGAPSTEGAQLKALMNHTSDPDAHELISAVREYKDVRILLSTFIPALLGARPGPFGWHYMHGNFNLGGTVSGRLSSSNPNLQNIPSGSRLAKWIKRCIQAPPGWVFMGLDFDSLEDKISALVTKDPNKLKVYTDGYDGHCLRAYSYFGDRMPDIDGSDVESINSIAVKYPQERQDSKAPTFALTYGGTIHALQNQCGFDLTTAKAIDKNYHDLYKVSDQFVKTTIEGARKNGYITVAFGLRVRTPVLSQTIDSKRHTPFAAAAEARTAGNAIGQSWGLLNNRAASAFMKDVRLGSVTRDNIRICCQIHDAQYYMVKNDAKLIGWFNNRLVAAVQWQEHPAIQHPTVKLSGQTSVFYPTWAEEYPMPLDCMLEDEVMEFGEEIAIKHKEKKNA